MVVVVAAAAAWKGWLQRPPPNLKKMYNAAAAARVLPSESKISKSCQLSRRFRLPRRSGHRQTFAENSTINFRLVCPKPTFLIHVTSADVSAALSSGTLSEERDASQIASPCLRRMDGWPRPKQRDPHSRKSWPNLKFSNRCCPRTPVQLSSISPVRPVSVSTEPSTSNSVDSTSFSSTVKTINTSHIVKMVRYHRQSQSTSATQSATSPAPYKPDLVSMTQPTKDQHTKACAEQIHRLYCLRRRPMTITS